MSWISRVYQMTPEAMVLLSATVADIIAGCYYSRCRWLCVCARAYVRVCVYVCVVCACVRA